MMYLWTVITAVVGAVSAWFFLDEFGQREMKKLRQENERLRKQLQHLKSEPVKFVESNAKVESIGCETYLALEDLDNPEKAAKYIGESIRRRMSTAILSRCDIETIVDPVMRQLIVRARLRVVPCEESKDIHTVIKQFIVETAGDTRFGIANFIAGNPGAARFVTEAYAKNAVHAENDFLRMLSIGVVGDKLYMLWNDCCECDTALAMAVMNELPEEEILRHINYEQGRGIPFTDEEKEKLNYE